MSVHTSMLCGCLYRLSVWFALGSLRVDVCMELMNSLPKPDRLLQLLCVKTGEIMPYLLLLIKMTLLPLCSEAFCLVYNL